MKRRTQEFRAGFKWGEEHFKEVLAKFRISLPDMYEINVCLHMCNCEICSLAWTCEYSQTAFGTIIDCQCAFCRILKDRLFRPSN